MAPLLETLRHPYASLRAWQAGLSGLERLVVFAMAAYAILMSALTVAKVGALRTYAWDLGTYSQALYTTAFQGRFFYYTADLPNNPSGSMFGAHFTPLLLVFVPLYRLLPSPATILIAQTLVIAAGAPIVFQLARLRLKDERLAALLAVGWLLNPVVQGVNWFDFHPEAFMMVFLLAVIWAWEERAWRWLGIFLALTLSTLEVAGVLVATLGLFWALEVLLAKRSLRPLIGAPEFRLAVLLATVGGLWVYVGLQAIALVNPGNALLSGGTGFWQVLGADSLLQVPGAAVANPGRLVAALAYDLPLKLWYLILLFGPVLFWPLRRPLTLLLLAPWLVAALTSNLLAYYVVGTQYGAFVAPMVFYGAILGLERNGPRPPEPASPADLPAEGRRPVWWSPRSPWTLAALAVAFVIVMSPASPFAVGVYSSGGFPTYTAHDALVQQIASLIPADASVLTQNNLFPLFANRPDAYVIPHTTFFGPGDSFNRTLRAYFNESEFVFIDGATSLTETMVVLQALQAMPGFGVLAAADGALLLQRGYTGPPRLFLPLEETYGARDLTLVNGTEVADGAAWNGVALESTPGRNGSFWKGPDAVLWPGTYTVTFRVRLANATSGPVLGLAIRLRPGFIYVVPEAVSAHGSGVRLATWLLSCSMNLTVENVTGGMFPSTTAYATLSVPLIADLFGVYDFAGFLPGTSATVLLDRVTVVQAEALPYVRTIGCPP